MGHPRPSLWCPHCRGKQVYYFKRQKNGKNWNCNACNKDLSKDELIKLNPKLGKCCK